jgi:hypothetical protein
MELGVEVAGRAFAVAGELRVGVGPGLVVGTVEYELDAEAPELATGAVPGFAVGAGFWLDAAGCAFAVAGELKVGGESGAGVVAGAVGELKVEGVAVRADDGEVEWIAVTIK